MINYSEFTKDVFARTAEVFNSTGSPEKAIREFREAISVDGSPVKFGIDYTNERVVHVEAEYLDFVAKKYNPAIAKKLITLLNLIAKKL